MAEAENPDKIESILGALKLDEFEEAAVSILAQMEDPPDVGSVFFARPRQLVDPQNFYVIPLKNEKILPYVEQPGIQCSASDLQSGIIIIYKQSDKFKRGLIREITDNKCKIFAMDYGCEDDDVDIKNVFRPLPKEASLMPPLAYHCEMYLSNPYPSRLIFSEETINAFKELMSVPNEKLRIEVKSTNLVKLGVTVTNSNNDIGTLLNLTQFAQLVKAPQIKPPNTFPWRHKKLSPGQILTVRIQHGSCFSEMFVCTKEDYKDYCLTRADFGAYCKIQNEISEEDFNLGTPVGVLAERSVYERGVIENILVPKSEAQIRLVDWGKLITVTKDKVRPIRSEIYSMTPVRAFYCCALNGHEFVGKLPHSLSKGYLYKMTIKKTGSKFKTPYMVTLKLYNQNK